MSDYLRRCCIGWIGIAAWSIAFICLLIVATNMAQLRLDGIVWLSLMVIVCGHYGWMMLDKSLREDQR